MRTIGVLMIVVISGGRALLAGEAELRRLHTEYPTASQVIIDRLSQVRGSGHMTSRPANKTKKPRRGDFDFQVDHGFQKCWTRGAGSLRDTGVGVIYCWGSAAGFTLARSTDGGRLTVHARGRNPVDRGDYERAFGRYFCAPYSIERLRPLAEMLLSASVQDLVAESVVIDGRKCIRARFTRGQSKQFDVTVDLDPELGWVIRGASMRYGAGPKSVRSFRAHYDANRRLWPMPLWVEFEDLDRTTTRCEFREVKFAPSPAEEFTMSYHGLPDLAGDSNSLALKDRDSRRGEGRMPTSGAVAGRSWWTSSLFLTLIAIAAFASAAALLLGRAARRVSS